MKTELYQTLIVDRCFNQRMATSPRLFVIKISDPGYENEDYNWALNHQDWAFRRPLKDDMSPGPGDVILYCSSLDGGSPRVQSGQYTPTRAGHIAFATAVSSPYDPDAVKGSVPPRLPSEVYKTARKYSVRLAISFFGEATDVDLSVLQVLHEPLRLSAITGSTPRVVDTNNAGLDAVASAFGFGSWDDLIAQSGIPADPRTFAIEKSNSGTSGTKKTSNRKRRVQTGQGWVVDPIKRKAIEIYAVEAAEDYYQAQGWTTQRRGAPYDLECTKGPECLHVEVKGTTGSLSTVLLTKNEVAHANEHETELFILANIVAEIADADPQNKICVCSGGDWYLYESWVPDASALTATTFVYEVPKTASAQASL